LPQALGSAEMLHSRADPRHRCRAKLTEEMVMAKTRGTGLLMVWTDVDPEFEAEFNRWYDEEHIARPLQIPGFLSAGRYIAVKGAPKISRDV
jgi:hypothetical protein